MRGTRKTPAQKRKTRIRPNNQDDEKLFIRHFCHCIPGIYRLHQRGAPDARHRTGHPCRAQVGGDTRQIFALRERDTRQGGRSDPQRRPRHPLGHPFGRRGTRHRGRLPDRARLPRRRPQRGAHPRIGAAPVVRRTLRRRLLRRGGRRETFGPGRSPAREPQPHDPPCLQRRQEGDAPHPRGPRRHAACDPCRRGYGLSLQRRAAADAVAPDQPRQPVRRQVDRRCRRAVRRGVEILDGRQVDHRRRARRRRHGRTPRPEEQHVGQRRRGLPLEAGQRRQRLQRRRLRLQFRIRDGRHLMG